MGVGDSGTGDGVSDGKGVAEGMATSGIVTEGGIKAVGEIVGVNAGVKVAANGVGVMEAVAAGVLQALRQRSRSRMTKIPGRIINGGVEHGNFR